MRLPVCAAYFTKQPRNRYYCLEARHGIRPRQVSHQGRLAYGRQEANETSGWYLDVPKLGAGSLDIAHIFLSVCSME